MWILDFSGKLSTGADNYYVFNPSILAFGDKFLITYRIASYDIPMQYHPWKIWDNGYKFFKNAEAAMSTKYRNALGGPIMIPLTSCPIVQKYPEFDSTGLAVATLGPAGFDILYNVANLFPGEMNQDARVVYSGGVYTIIYNVFETGGIKLRCRDLVITDSIYLSAERYLFKHMRAVEKHCCYGDSRSIIHYGIGDKFEIIRNGVLSSTPMKHFNYLYTKYGKQYVHISLSTPSVKYNNRNIACGHVKIQYAECNLELLSHCDRASLKLHGKFIYFMFLYEFVTDTITRVSPLFIPTINDNHLPYLLVMPIGMTSHCGKYIISYGEGDCRCKCVILSAAEIENLLTSSAAPSFLTEKLDINHVGYWNKFNCGDDAFKVVFKHMYNNTPHKVTFCEQYNPGANINVLGGGDVLNNYFCKKVPTNSVAISVGIPYAEFIPMINLFKAVYLRNKYDNAALSTTKYIPDLAFMLPLIYGRPTRANSKSIGIILARTYYAPTHPELYNNFCDGIVKFARLANAAGFKIVFIPFCVNKNKAAENDLVMIRDICISLPFAEVFEPGQDYVRDIYMKIASMDFNICSRFHAHIFSTIHAVPFISLTCGRKCIEYMRQLPDCLYRLKTNDLDLPLGLDGEQLFKFFKAKYYEKDKIRARLIEIYNVASADLAKFNKQYISMLRRHASGASITLWIPSAPHSEQLSKLGSSPSYDPTLCARLPHAPSGNEPYDNTHNITMCVDNISIHANNVNICADVSREECAETNILQKNIEHNRLINCDISAAHVPTNQSLLNTYNLMTPVNSVAVIGAQIPVYAQLQCANTQVHYVNTAPQCANTQLQCANTYTQAPYTLVNTQVMQPAVMQPAVMQPAVMQPAVMQPAVMQPAVMQFTPINTQQYTILQPSQMPKNIVNYIPAARGIDAITPSQPHYGKEKLAHASSPPY